jgi:hypothetical protein
MRRAGVALLLLAAGPCLADGLPNPLRGQDVAQRAPDVEAQRAPDVEAQRARDIEACEKLAMDKSGLDPARPETGTVRQATGAEAGKPVTAAPGPRPSEQAIYERERSACLVGRGYKLGG